MRKWRRAYDLAFPGVWAETGRARPRNRPALHCPYDLPTAGGWHSLGAAFAILGGHAALVSTGLGLRTPDANWFRVGCVTLGLLGTCSALGLLVIFETPYSDLGRDRRAALPVHDHRRKHLGEHLPCRTRAPAAVSGSAVTWCEPGAGTTRRDRGCRAGRIGLLMSEAVTHPARCDLRDGPRTTGSFQ